MESEAFVQGTGGMGFAIIRPMAEFDAILQRSRLLNLADRLKLARMLFEEARAEDRADEVEAGLRGLATWTESARGGDWSEFYPAGLRRRKVG